MKSTPNLRYIGLDVHKKWMQVCMLDRRGKVLNEGRFPATPDQLRAFARSLRPTDAIALEATGFTWALVDLLERHAGRVVVSNPLQTRAIAHAKVKTDKVDARVLADLLRCDYLPEVWRPDAQTRHWRGAVHFRDMFVRRRTQLKNQIHAIFHRNLLVFDGSDLFELDLLLDELDHNDQHVLALGNLLAKQAYDLKDVHLLMTIPGVDYIAAVSLLAAIGDIARFPSPKHLASYFGLTSRVSQSGQHCFLGRITKRGRSHGRWIAVQAAYSLYKAPGPIQHFYLRIKKRKGHNVAVVAVARKLVTLARHILTKREPYRYAVPATTEKKLAQFRLVATGQRRKRGIAPGTPRSKNWGTGRQVRRIKSLSQIYTENQLPPLRPLSAGERKMLSRLGLTAQTMNNLYKEKTVPRKPARRRQTKNKNQLST